MKLLSNAHTHTTYCDGKTPLQDMVLRAKELGFVSLGFTGHAMQGFDFDYSMSEEGQKAYLAELRALQAQNSPVLPRIWAGLELDSMADESCRKAAFEAFDYIILSSHYFERSWHGKCVSVDDDPDTLTEYRDQVCGGDGLELVRRFYHQVIRSCLAQLPAIIGHFDLIRKYAVSASLFDPESKAYRKIASDALEQVYPCGAVLEINTGAMARKTLDTPYPTLPLLEQWHDMGGQITITSDCHDARYLDYAFDDAACLARNAGFTHVLRLGTGRELWEELSL